MIKRLTIVLMVAGLVAATSLVSAPSAGAAPEVRTYAISGTIQAGPLPFPLPSGSTLTATVETTTGVYTDGVMSIPTFVAPNGQPVPTNVTMTSIGAVTGTIDLVTGASTSNVSLSIALTDTVPVSTCTIGPVDLALSTSGTGGAPIIGTPPSGTMVAAGFTVPAVTPDAACDAGVEAGTNNFLMLPQTTTQATLTVTQTAPVPETPTTTPTTQPTATAPATAAVPVAASPTFTG